MVAPTGKLVSHVEGGIVDGQSAIGRTGERRLRLDPGQWFSMTPPDLGLHHLPHSAIGELRAGRGSDSSSMRAMANEIQPLYSPNIVRFGGEGEYYSTVFFTDPGAAGLQRSNSEPIAIDLGKVGRDLWHWNIGQKISGLHRLLKAIM